MSLAWHAEALARQKRLQPLKHYLAGPRNGPAEMLAHFRALRRGGKAITIAKG